MLTPWVTSATLDLAPQQPLPATGNGSSFTYTVPADSIVTLDGMASTTPVTQAPVGLLATASSTSAIQLSWTNNLTGATGYTVERSPDGVNWTTLSNSLSSTTYSYTDSGLAENTLYYYRVIANNATVYSNVSNAMTQPKAPSNLTASYNASTQNVSLSWTGNSSAATDYAIDESTDGGTTWTEVYADIKSGTTSFTDTAAPDLATVIYRVRAIYGANSSAPSNTYTVTTTVLRAPTSLAVAVNGVSLQITWTDATTTNATVDVERSTNDSTWTVLASMAHGTQTYTDTTVSEGGTYYYRIRNVLGSTDSAYTTSGATTVPDQAPTVATPASAVASPVTGTSVALSVLGADAGGESNLTYTWATTGTPPAAVTFSANGTNAAQDTTATFHEAGTYNFQVTITNAVNLSVTSNVSVTVNQTPSSIAVSPFGATVAPGGQAQFSATAKDQFGVTMAAQPTITWSTSGRIGAINSSGLFVAGSSQLTGAVVASSGAASGWATVSVSTLPAPLAWYRFGEGSGTTVHDSSGNGYSGTISGGATFGTGISGGDLVFNGTSGSVSLGNPAGLNITGTITLAAWIDPRSGSGIQDIVGRSYNTSPGQETVLRIDNGSYQIGAWNGSNYFASASIRPGDLDTWVYLIGVYDGTAWRLYRDGTLVAGSTSTVGALQVAENWTIGSSAVSNRYFDGSIDEVRIYNAALSAAQVATLYNTYFPPTIAMPAAANPATVSGTSTALSVLGALVAGASSLKYTWATTGTPPAAVTFSANGTNAAQNTTATFTAAGTYAFQVTITDALGQTTTSSVSVTVTQTPQFVSFSAAAADLDSESTQQFTLTGLDQFGQVIPSLSGGDTISVPLSLADNTTFSTAANSCLTVGGAISGGVLSEIGSGTLVLSGANSYAGGTMVIAGTLDATSPGALPSGSSLVIGVDAVKIFAAATATANPASTDAEKSSLAAAAPVAQTPTASPKPFPQVADINERLRPRYWQWPEI